MKKSKYLQGCIDDCINSDFNPDIVLWALDDLETHSMVVGATIGGLAATLCCTIAVAIASILEKRKEKNEEK